MVTRVLADTGRGGRTVSKAASRDRGRRKRSPGRGEPQIPMEERLQGAIEIERDQLSKAESLLGCVAISMEYGTESPNPPYYPDLVDMARELVRRSINGLDAVALQRHLQRNKVKEEALAGWPQEGWFEYVGRSRACAFAPNGLAAVTMRQEQAVTMA